jgi:hypothetical protein
MGPAAENFPMQQDPRRASPRIGVEALCWEMIGERERSALVVDLSTHGARIERPFLPAGYHDYDALELGPAGRSSYVTPAPRPSELARIVPLQLEVPEIDEVMWARGEVMFDELVEARGPGARGGPFNLVRRTGYHLSLAATRDMRLLRDYIYDMHAKQQAANDESVDWLRCFG